MSALRQRLPAGELRRRSRLRRAGADVPTRLGYLNQYLEHVAAARAPPARGTAAPAAGYLSSSYGALANAAWAWTSGFGFTAVSVRRDAGLRLGAGRRDALLRRLARLEQRPDRVRLGSVELARPLDRRLQRAARADRSASRALRSPRPRIRRRPERAHARRRGARQRSPAPPSPASGARSRTWTPTSAGFALGAADGDGGRRERRRSRSSSRSGRSPSSAPVRRRRHAHVELARRLVLHLARRVPGRRRCR